MATDLLSYTLEGKVAVVRMDDGKANALSEAMIDALVGAVDRAEREASAMLLVGRPDRFCAGFDLRVMMSSPDAARALLARGAEMLMRLYGSKVPLVIACTGHALAGGALVLLTGDVRIGAEGTFRIGLNEVSIGMPVPILAMELARDRVIKEELTNATLLAKIYDPATAAHVGYLDATAPVGEVVERAKAEAIRLAELPRQAFVGTKERLRSKTIAHVRDSLVADFESLLPRSTGSP
jgi:enoyl-CoA hydratase